MEPSYYRIFSSSYLLFSYAYISLVKFYIHLTVKKMQSTPEAICVIFMKIAVTHNKSKIIFKINPLVRYSWEFCNMFENTFFIEQNWTTDSEPTSSIHPAHNLQSSFKIAKKKIITCYMICMQVDLAKYLFKVLGISD